MYGSWLILEMLVQTIPRVIRILLWAARDEWTGATLCNALHVCCLRYMRRCNFDLNYRGRDAGDVRTGMQREGEDAMRGGRERRTRGR